MTDVSWPRDADHETAVDWQWLAHLMLAVGFGARLALTPARADVAVQIDKSSQRMA